MNARVNRLFPCAFALLAACSAAVADSTSSQHSKVEAASSRAGAQPFSARAPVAAQTSGARAVFYDLARHRADAERRIGSAVVVDFGAPGDAKYTLGGWNTRMRPGIAIDGSTVSFVSGSYGDVIVPTQGKGKQLLRLRVRAPRDGGLVAYLDDKVIGHLKSKPSEFAIHDLELPAELPAGEHMLRLRAAGIGRIGAHETAFALDWLSVGDTAP